MTDLYGVEVSSATIGTITDKVWLLAEAWYRYATIWILCLISVSSGAGPFAAVAKAGWQIHQRTGHAPDGPSRRVRPDLTRRGKPA